MQGRALFPQRDSKGDPQVGIKQLCSYSRIRRTTYQLHQIPKTTTPKGKSQAVALSVVKKTLSDCFVSLSWSKQENFRTFSKTAGAARSRKMVVNGMADCFTLRKRIVKMCKFRGPIIYIHPEKGFPSTGSMAPC